MTTSTHISVTLTADFTAPAEPFVHTYELHGPIARVSLDGGTVTVQSMDPAMLEQTGQAFLDAAALLHDARQGAVA